MGCRVWDHRKQSPCLGTQWVQWAGAVDGGIAAVSQQVVDEDDKEKKDNEDNTTEEV